MSLIDPPRAKSGQGPAHPSAMQDVYVMPATFAQQRLWFIDRLAPNRPTYNVPQAWRLSGPLHVEALQAALNALTARHEALRTTFDLIEGEPAQIIAPALQVELSRGDVQSLPLQERNAAALALLREDAARPFDLRHGPLLRGCLVNAGKEQHYLQINCHHTITDAWSERILASELSVLYAAQLGRQEAPLPPLPIQYGDFAQWQRQQLQGAALERLLNHWKERLGGELPALELPTDHPRPAAPTQAGAHVSLKATAALAGEIKALARRKNATPFMVLLAAFEVLLHRFCGQDDLLIGTPIACRSRRDVEGLIGFFANTLLIRADLSNRPTFEQLLQRVREATLHAQAGQDMPFDKLVQALAPQRDLRQYPLVQVAFVYREEAPANLLLPGLVAQPLTITSGTSKFDLMLSVGDTPEGLELAIEYSTELFEAATVHRMLGCYLRLLRALAADPGRSVDEYPLLSQPQRRRMLEGFNRTQRDYPREANLAEVFTQSARAAAGTPAVIDGQRQMTYRQLDEQSSRLARRLAQMGVGPDVPVAIGMDRGLEMIVAMLAILKAGGAYVPLDPAYPKDRLAFMIEDTQAPVLLTQSRLRASLPANSAKVLCLDDDSPDLLGGPCDPLPCPARAGNVAYIMYTSGSTGRPKGVQVTHRNVLRLVCNADYIQLGPDQVFLQHAPTSFDAATLEIWGALLHGARLVLYPERIPTLEGLAQIIARHRVTCLWIPTGLFITAIDQKPGLMRGVSQIFTGGDVLDIDHARRALALLPGSRLNNAYGPTESTTFASVFPMSGQEDRIGRSVPIGRPIANTRFYVLDGWLNPVPLGVAGELCIGGDGVARGYLNRPELTAQKFLPDPFDPTPGARMYRTGDMVRWLKDGTIEFLGRRDQQVKVHGFRIELGEIETALRGCRGVRQAAVVVRQDRPGDKRVVGYVTASAGARLSPEELRPQLSEKLPAFMVPAAIVVLEALPLSPNGKLDRKALPPPPRPSADDPKDDQPQSDVQKRLAALWAKVLEVERVGLHQSFFDLGGHSLLAVRLFARIQEQFGRDLPLSTLFEGPTVAHLASLLDTPQVTSVQRSLVPLGGGGRGRPFFCVHGIGGEVLCFKPLAKRLAADRSFYGLQARGLGSQHEPDESIEAMAQRYIEEIRSVAPRGPYALGGFSSGASIAYEMARRLTEAGEAIALLAVLDSSPPNTAAPPRGPVFRAADFLTNLPWWVVDDLMRSNPRRTLTRVWGKLHQALDQTQTDKQTLNTRALFGVSDLPARRQRFLQAHYRAFQSYYPWPAPLRVTLFRSRTRPLFGRYDPIYGWGALARKGVEVHIVPGAHESILHEPYVHHLAAALGRCLAGTDSGSG